MGIKKLREMSNNTAQMRYKTLFESLHSQNLRTLEQENIINETMVATYTGRKIVLNRDSKYRADILK